MRVLRLLTRPNAGGPTRQATALWHAHRALGVRTLLVVGTCDGEPELAPAEQGVPELGFAEAIARGQQAEGVVVLPGLQRGGGPLALWRAATALRSLLRAFRPEVVHTHLAKAGLIGRVCAVREGIRVVAHTFHGHVLTDYFAWPKQIALRALERRLATRTTLLFAVSRSCREELIALGIGSGAQLRELPPAVDLGPARATSRVAARARLKITGEHPVLAWCGRLVPIKRFELFAEVLRRLPDTVALVVGDGPERSRVESLGERVHWLPFAANPWETLAAADVLLMPSLREGMPLAALEALAAGVGVAGCAVAGVRDLLEQALPNRLLPAWNDTDGLTGLTAELLASPQLRAEQARQCAPLLAECTPSKVAGALLAAYEAVLENQDDKATCPQRAE